MDSYDEKDYELCTWQDCNYIGTWGSTQDELNENFISNMKLINEIVRKNDINIDDYFYTYTDKYQMILYFPLRLIKTECLDDYLFVLKNKNRIIHSLNSQYNKNSLYQMIEGSTQKGTGVLFDTDYKIKAVK